MEVMDERQDTIPTDSIFFEIAQEVQTTPKMDYLAFCAAAAKVPCLHCALHCALHCTTADPQRFFREFPNHPANPNPNLTLTPNPTCRYRSWRSAFSARVISCVSRKMLTAA